MKELTCRFKIDISNLANFDSSTQKFQKFTLQWVGSEQMFELKKYRGVIFYDTGK